MLAALFAAPAHATHSATDFTLQPASPEAGASVNASSSTTLSYGGSLTEDVKKTIGHFAPGLLANPEAVPHCPQALYLADACPADTLIGSSQAVVNGLVTENGRIYNQELLGGEAGRLGIIVDASTGKLFLTAPFYVRTDGDYGLDGILDDIPRLTPGTQITKLSFTLFGKAQGRNFTRGPTSCSLKISTGEAFGYEHDVSVSGPSSSYTPTECYRLPFKPTFAISAGSPGTTGFKRNPSLRVRVTQQPGEAGVLGNGLTLPKELTPDTGSFGQICSENQLAAGSCPAGARVGDAGATSPFLATPLSGPVWLVQKAGSVLPALVADLRGRVPVKITITTAIIGGSQVRSTVSNVPDLPIGSFDLSLYGGPDGVLLNKSDLCFANDARSRFRTLTADVTFAAHSGALTNSRPRIGVEGCAPAVSGSLRGRSRPKLSLRLKRHPDAQKIRRADLVLPKGLALVRSKVRRLASGKASKRLARSAFKVRGKHRLSVTGLPKQGASALVVRLGRGSLKARGKLRKALRIKVVSTDVKGKRVTGSARIRVRR
jgi:hypothetical protein